jgi:uncharacterized membrane protein YphA (DoxX/SURF4 family)
MSVIFLVGRILVGGYYIYNAFHHFLELAGLAEYAKGKRVPAPKLAVGTSGVLLLIAGITLLLGIYPEIGVICLVLFFVPVSVMMHNFWAEQGGQRLSDMINFTKNMALLASALMFLLISKPWPLSLMK